MVRENTSETLTMTVELSVIENLGFRMYTRLPAVISELVANAWDAEAEVVEIAITETPEGQEVSVRDNGLGMTYSEVQACYLKVGRNRREEEGTDRTSGEKKRPLMGRKGIGKLSAFGIAKEIQIRTVKNSEITHFLMNIDDILTAAKTGEPYRPLVLEHGSINEKSGTVVTLRKLKRKSPVDVPNLRQNLARRFSVLGSDFVVKVNGDPITPEERNLEARCEFVWRVPGDLIEAQITPDRPDWLVRGWIGTFPTPVPSDVGTGIVLMAKGKLAQEPTFFNVGKMDAQHALAYMVGEIHADFLDGEEDLISAYRGSIVWMSEAGEALERWGREAVKRVAKDWAKKRREKRTKVVTDIPGFREWYAHLLPLEQRRVDKIVDVITSVPEDDPKKTRALIHHVIAAFDYRSFVDLVQELERLPAERAGDLLRLFHEWKLIEAREIFKIVEGRLAAINKLDQLVRSNAREVPEIHNFLAENPWILEPTWTIIHNEVYYSQLLKEEFADQSQPVERRRIDLVCLGVGDTVHVVELKRPGIRLGSKDVQQVQDYVGFVSSRLGSHPTRSYRYAKGYLVGGELDAHARTVLHQYTKDIYFYSYTDLLSNAHRVHREFIEVLQKLGLERPVLAAFAEDVGLFEVEAWDEAASALEEEGCDGRIGGVCPS